MASPAKAMTLNTRPACVAHTKARFARMTRNKILAAASICRNRLDELRDPRRDRFGCRRLGGASPHRDRFFVKRLKQADLRVLLKLLRHCLAGAQSHLVQYPRRARNFLHRSGQGTMVLLRNQPTRAAMLDRLGNS